MADETITLTQAELDARVEEAVASATKDLEKKHNAEMYNARKEIKDLKNANLSQEELEKKVREEQDEAITKELNELRSFKKGKVLEERLAKEGLPSYLKNDIRLLNADDDSFDKVLKGVKAEYEATLPKGNQHSTVVRTGGKGATTGGNNDKTEVYGEFAQSLKDLVGR